MKFVRMLDLKEDKEREGKRREEKRREQIVV
jgi:hypothetical protein